MQKQSLSPVAEVVKIERDTVTLMLINVGPFSKRRVQLREIGVQDPRGRLSYELWLMFINNEKGYLLCPLLGGSEIKYELTIPKTALPRLLPKLKESLCAPVFSVGPEILAIGFP